MLVIGATALGCGGGGGGGSRPRAGTLLTFGNFPVATNSPGPNTTPIAAAFRDQVVRFVFDQDVDGTSFGGLHAGAGNAPLTFVGRSEQGALDVPYYAFADQAAARTSLQLRLNRASADFYGAYIVGRSAADPQVVIIDPVVPAGNFAGTTPSVGFPEATELVWAIPAANGFRFRGQPANAAGADPAALPLIVGAPQGLQPPPIFLCLTDFAPTTDPLTVVAVTSQTGASGGPGPGGARPATAGALGDAEPITIHFSRPIDGSTFVTGANVAVVNEMVALAAGRATPYVFGTFAPVRHPVAPSVTPYDDQWVFQPSFGYGGNGTTASNIRVDLGLTGTPVALPPILSVPIGLGAQRDHLPTAIGLFQVGVCTSCVNTAAVNLNFQSQADRDATYLPPFGNATWDAPQSPGLLTGRVITGSALGNTAPTLGTRVQVLVDPQPPTTFPSGLFSPFDAALANSGGLCGSSGCNLGVNPAGGSHIMHLYEAADLASIRDSLELVEWSPLSGTTVATTYPQYQVWCGITSVVAPLTGGPIAGLGSVFDANYRYATWQGGAPISTPCAFPGASSARRVSCGGPSPYVVTAGTSEFYPFPLFNPPFDFGVAPGVTGTVKNLVIEQNIESGAQAPNFNRYRATAFTPVRRLLARPLSLVASGTCALNEGGSFDIYRMRFTFVGRVSSTRSTWFDTGVADPQYLGFTPAALPLPVGNTAAAAWTLEGVDSIPAGNATPPAFSGQYLDSAGMTHPAVLTGLTGFRYFRFRVDITADTVLNAVPSFSAAQMAFRY